MKPLSSTVRGNGTPFAPTHWSVVLAAAQGDRQPLGAEAALAELCQTYWAPLYTFVRGRGHDTHDAEDLTQGFFAHLIEHRIYERADAAKGKFRSFLLAAMKNYLANVRDREQASKRGGTQPPLPLIEAVVRRAEEYYQAQHRPATPATNADRSYERNWARAVVDGAMKRVAQVYTLHGKQALFTALQPFIAGGDETPSSYDQIGASLAVPASTLRSHITRLRRHYREALHAEVRRTVGTEVEVREELSALLRVLAKG